MSNYTQYPFCQDYNRIGINDETIIQYQTELNCKILINYIVEGRSHEKKKSIVRYQAKIGWKEAVICINYILIN